MRRKLLSFRNYALGVPLDSPSTESESLNELPPDCSAPADQEAHLSSNILFGVAASITPLASHLASHCDLEVKRKKKNEDAIRNNLIYPLHRAYTKDYGLLKDFCSYVSLKF